MTANDAASGDAFGSAVAISRDTLVAGAYGADGFTGSAYIFERNQDGTDRWGQVGKLTADDAAGGDFFGWSVSISGNTTAVGAPFDDDGGGSSGSTYVFQWSATAVHLPLVFRSN
jgi:hypothetical protein